MNKLDCAASYMAFSRNKLILKKREENIAWISPYHYSTATY